MTTAFTSANTTGTAALSPSRWRNRIGVAGLSACGLAALAWASCAPPLPRLIYNPSDSVAVGWYRVELIDHQADSQPQLLAVGSIALVRLPADAAALAAQRGQLQQCWWLMAKPAAPMAHQAPAVGSRQAGLAPL